MPIKVTMGCRALEALDTTDLTDLANSTVHYICALGTLQFITTMNSIRIYRAVLLARPESEGGGGGRGR
jgi:hypothetical protein